jgi:hypothetical protein
MDLSLYKAGARPDSTEQHDAAPDYESKYKAGVTRISSLYVNMASDLRQFSPRTRHDQGGAGTCVTNSGTRGLEIKRVMKFFAAAKARGLSDADALKEAFSNHVALSRAALYYEARELMEPMEIDKDSGTRNSLAAAALSTWGVPPEVPIVGRPASECWGYSDQLAYLCTPPSWMAMRSAAAHKINGWAKLKSTGSDLVEDVIANLAVGNPVWWAKPVGANYLQYKKGDVIRPVNGTVAGNHATLLVGWDPLKNGGVFWDENSWANSWGDDGFAMVSPDVIEQEGFDLIVLEGGWETWLETV